MLVVSVVLASVVVLTAAQDPTKLKISPTFTAQGEAEWHLPEETRFGNGRVQCSLYNY